MADTIYLNTSKDARIRWVYGCVLFMVLLPLLLWAGVIHVNRETLEAVTGMRKAIVLGDKETYLALFAPSARARAEKSWELLRATESVLGHVRGCTVQRQGVMVSHGKIKPTATFILQGSRDRAQMEITLARSDGVWRVENVQLCFR